MTTMPGPATASSVRTIGLSINPTVTILVRPSPLKSYSFQSDAQGNHAGHAIVNRFEQLLDLRRCQVAKVYGIRLEPPPQSGNVGFEFFSSGHRCSSEWNGEGIVDGQARAVGGLEDADSFGRTNQVHAIEGVDDHDPVDDLADSGDIESALHAEIDLNHGRQLLEVGKAGTQTAAVCRVDAEAPGFPVVCGAGTHAEQRLMVEHDIMVVDIGEF